VTHAGERPFEGTRRFQLIRRLGAGGAGIVYEALDRDQASRVALKVLHTISPEGLLRFKHEFRAMQDLQHPNLVTLGELIEEAGQWFFTMEFVDGVDFLNWVRVRADDPEPARPPLPARLGDEAATGPTALRPTTSESPIQLRYDDQRLRRALVQLARGLQVLHAAGKVHRDIKPSNLLVADTGRLVILDFGLVLDVDRPVHLTRADHVVGTADYMAPEQAGGRAIGQAADWYSVGVILFQALTGRLPYVGSRMEVLVDKQAHAAPLPSSLVPMVPRDLDGLCQELLSRDPTQRPRALDILRRLLPGPSELASLEPPPAPHASAVPFVGRRAELAELAHAFEQTREGAAVTVYLVGESGVGKSALARQFAESMVIERGAVLLSGRCYERESVPYKAVDGLIDELGRYMATLPRDEASALLPLRASLLPQVFPVLRRVEAIAEAPVPFREVADPKELRAQVFFALRELLARLTERRPLILLVDDLQWTDADSLALLRELLRPPDPPTMLLLATVRLGAESPEGAGGRERSSSGSLGVLRPSPLEEGSRLPGPVRELLVGRMPDEDAQRLTALLVGGPAEASPEVEAIAREAHGHPLFIDELVRHARSGQARGQGIALEEVLWRRIQQIDAPARAIMELIAVAGAPVAEEIAAQATAMNFADFTRFASILRAANLVRMSGARRSDTVEPYHDRVRAAVLSHLEQTVRQSWHGRLALALEASGDFEALAVHWRGAGKLDRAAGYAVRAAAQAAETLAFDRAARLYRLALKLGPPPGSSRAGVLSRLGEALANAGRGGDAAQAYLEAAPEVKGAEALDLKRRAGDQLLLSGRIDEGLAVLGEVLQTVGMKLARTPRKALLPLVLRRAQIRLRGLGFRERPASEIAQSQLQRVDLCFSIAGGLAIDTVRGAHFQTRHLLLALRAGEPYRVARALCAEAAYSASAGVARLGRSGRLIQMAGQLADRMGSVQAQAYVAGAAGVTAFCQGRWRDGLEILSRAEELFRDRCTGVAWELAGSRLFLLRSLYMLGSLDQLRRRLPALRAEALELGNIYAAAQLQSGILTIDWLMQDAPGAARSITSEAIAKWSQQGTHVTHFSYVLGMAQIHLYEGNGPEAHAFIGEQARKLARAMLLRVQVIRAQLLDMKVRCALAAARAAPPQSGERRRLVDEADRQASRLGRERAAWATALAHLGRAGVAAARGERAAAIERYEEAERRCEAYDMRMHAQMARRRRGELLGGEAGGVLVEAVDTWLADQGAKRPERLADMIAPLVLP
jgi:hypothetical protein